MWSKRIQVAHEDVLPSHEPVWNSLFSLTTCRFEVGCKPLGWFSMEVSSPYEPSRNSLCELDMVELLVVGNGPG